MTIRPATVVDLQRLADMGAAILARTPMGELFQPAPGQVHEFCARVLETGGVFVAEAADGHLEGMIGVTLELHALGLRYADEVAIWVDEDCRGKLIGPRLIRAAERWAVTNGATHLKMSVPVSSPELGCYLMGQDYRLIETVLVRDLGRRTSDLQSADSRARSRATSGSNAEDVRSPQTEDSGGADLDWGIAPWS